MDLTTQLRRARESSRGLGQRDRDLALDRIASAIDERRGEILMGNQQDLERETQQGMAKPLLDRLALTQARIDGILEGIRQIRALPDPVGRTLAGWRHPKGMAIQKVSVPFGVIGVIYESRPNVTVDAAALCLKAGSSTVLRGSSSARHSNLVLVSAMRVGLAAAGLPEDVLQLIDAERRESVTELLRARGLVDVVIPRGGAGLIRHVVENAQVPVIETGVGNCHLFVDRDADLEMALDILLNGKCQRPGVCNALETLLVHKEAAKAFLPVAAKALAEAGVQVRGCDRTRMVVPDVQPASEEDWGAEFLDLIIAVRVVDGLEDAIQHINRYGTQHSEAIVTRSLLSAQRFQDEVDAAAVYVNASTRFTDGFEYGFGAEIGISTQKLHARGPMGLAEMVTYQYRIVGEGQIR